MKFVINAIVVASILLGFCSPYIAMVLVPDGQPHDDLAYTWFFGIPAGFLAVVPWNDASAMFAAIGIYVVQWAVLFTALATTVWLVKWTFSSNSDPRRS
jgi:hypothetical protein